MAFLTVVACSGGETPLPDATVTLKPTLAPTPKAPIPMTEPTSTVSQAVEALPALRQMEIAFDGNPNVSRIQPVLDSALMLYGLPITEENYSRAGSVLVALRKEIGPSEMEILNHMIRSHVPGVNVTFPDMAGFCAAALTGG